jgi:hypothetical protein
MFFGAPLELHLLAIEHSKYYAALAQFERTTPYGAEQLSQLQHLRALATLLWLTSYKHPITHTVLCTCPSELLRVARGLVSKFPVEPKFLVVTW